MTVGELLTRADSAELAEWMAYEAVTGPLGAQRDDRLAALVAATVANAMRSRRRPFRLTDFLLWGERRTEQPWQQQLAIATALQASKFGGTITVG